jgi:peroxiredoxin
MSGDFKTPDGKKVSMKDLNSKVVVLSYWATWCSMCKEQMPWLMELSRKLSANGLTVVAATNEDAKTVRKYLEGKTVSLPILLDAGDTLLDRFKVQTVPTTVVIDQDGRVAFRVNTIFQWDAPEVIAALEGLLANTNRTASK